jgi:hypothetical protein
MAWVRDVPGGLVTVVCGGLVVISTVLLQVNAASVSSVKGVASAARRFEERFLAEVDELDGPVAVLSTAVPNFVTFSVFYPYNWAAPSIGELTTDVAWNDNSSDRLYRFDQSGTLIPIVVLPGTPALGVDAASTSAVPIEGREGCYTIRGVDDHLRFAFDVPVVRNDSTGFPLVVVLRGTTSRETGVRLMTVDRDGVATFVNGDDVAWEGAFDTVHTIDASSTVAIDLSGLRPGIELCVDDVEVTTIRDV